MGLFVVVVWRKLSDGLKLEHIRVDFSETAREVQLLLKWSETYWCVNIFTA